jgi:hypothetical protein
MSILSTIVGWFTSTPKQETPAPSAPAPAETTQDRVQQAKDKYAVLKAKIDETQRITQLEAYKAQAQKKAAEYRIRLAELKQLQISMAARHHEERIERAIELKRSIGAGLAFDDYAELIKLPMQTEVVDAYIEALIPLDYATEVEAGVSVQIGIDFAVMLKGVGL